MKKHKILFLDEIGRIDGAEVVLYNLVTNLDKDCFEPLVVCGSDGMLVDKLRSQKIRVSILKMREPFKLFFNIGAIHIFNPLSALVFFFTGFIFGIKFYFFLKENAADIVHTNTLMANLFGSIPVKVVGRKLVWHEHNIQPQGLRGWVLNIMAKFFPDRIIAISNAVRDIYKSVPDGHKIQTIYNGIDLLKFYALKHEGQSIKEELDIPKNFKIVAITAVLRPWKGHRYFLIAAKKILKEYKNVKFLIVGDEIFSKDRGYKDYLKNLAINLSIENDVIFSGFRSDIPQILSEIDILVSTSVMPEPFSLIILEAMASGKPVVATNTGGVPEVLEDGVTGILVNPRDSVALSDGILRLLRDEETARRMGHNGRQRAERLFSIQRFAKEIEGIYDEILNEGRGVHSSINECHASTGMAKTNTGQRATSSVKTDHPTECSIVYPR